MFVQSRLLLLALLLPVASRAWDYEGHRIVNQLALASLPADYPAFVKTPANAERVAFLAGEPDRWKNVPDLPLKQYNGMDHYCDLELIPDAGHGWYGQEMKRTMEQTFDFFEAHLRPGKPRESKAVTRGPAGSG